MTLLYRFETLIAPIALSAFLNRYYESEPLRLSRSDPGFYAGLLTMEGLEAWLNTGVARYPDVLLVQHETDIGRSEFADPNGKIDPERLFRRFEQGATIVVNNLERHLPELAALCRGAEKLFSMPFQTNIYLSPPNAQGFRTHYDTHDVFVLQAAGSKEWRLYDNKIVLPLPGQGFDKERDIPGVQTDAFTLETGDLLYCPRGLMHDARSTDQPSLHITFGLLGKTRTELIIEAVAAACLAEPELHRTLTPGYANEGFDRTALRETLAALLRRIADTGADLDKALDGMAENFLASRQPPMRGHLAERLAPPPLGLTDRLAVRSDLIWRFGNEAETLQLQVPGTTIDLPAFTREALTFMLTEPAFAVADIPGPIDDDARIVLANRFMREGLLTRVTGA